MKRKESQYPNDEPNETKIHTSKHSTNRSSDGTFTCTSKCTYVRKNHANKRQEEKNKLKELKGKDLESIRKFTLEKKKLQYFYIQLNSVTLRSPIKCKLNVLFKARNLCRGTLLVVERMNLFVNVIILV